MTTRPHENTKMGGRETNDVVSLALLIVLKSHCALNNNFEFNIIE